MNTTVINIKTSPEVKAEARRVADSLGLSLSAVINAYLRQLIKTKTVVFSAASEEPSEYLLSILKQSKEDIKKGRVSPAFDNAKEAVSWLKRQTS